MKVFKFGGASVKNADAVRNVADILEAHTQEQLIVVISAMGKMTNHLEAILTCKNTDERTQLISEFEHFHKSIANELNILSDFEGLLKQRIDHLSQVFGEISDPYARYDEVVSQGELVSTLLVECYLQHRGTNSTWLDARLVIKTEDAHQVTNVDWDESQSQAGIINSLMNNFRVIVTQGFIASNSKGATTTLGREGSDFSAAIMAYLVEAESATIWKDVPGMLNADPRWFEDTVKLEEVSYREAIELAYYGASVIHPKTVKPLQNKNIPLYVKSFLDYSADGTVIRHGVKTKPLVPSYIFKKDQLLISFIPKDFSFVGEKHLSDIFAALAAQKTVVNLMQNSAVSFSIVVDQKQINLKSLMEHLGNFFSIKFNESLELVTIRHYDEKTISQLTAEKEVLLEQRSRSTMRLILKQ